MISFIATVKKRVFTVIIFVSNLNFGTLFIKTLAYFIVSIITLIAFVIVLDTFKSPISGIFPNLELYLFNLIEILKDVKFFIKDLIF